jgi:transcriptional regulator GlxA family with amidase domain
MTDGTQTLGTPKTVGILIFDEVEVLDFCGPFEVFSMARALSDTPDGPGRGERLFTALTIAERAETVRCRGGLLVVPHHTIADHPPLDVVVVPGGQGTRRERTNRPVLDWVAEQAARAPLMTSVCTGAFLLAANGLLDGRRATTHWASIDWLREHHPAIDVRDDERIVDEGAIVTSAGVSAGIDMALHVVRRLRGDAVATETARQMEYDWAEAGRGVASPGR